MCLPSRRPHARASMNGVRMSEAFCAGEARRPGRPSLPEAIWPLHCPTENQILRVPENEISLCGKKRLCYNPNRAGWETQPAPATFGETVGDSLERVQHIVYRSKG